MKPPASLIVALALAATAGPASANARIAWGDLNMSSPAGADAFDARVEEAARRLCRNARKPMSLLSDRAFCRAAVQREAVRQLPGRVQVEYARSRRALVI